MTDPQSDDLSSKSSNDEHQPPTDRQFDDPFQAANDASDLIEQSESEADDLPSASGSPAGGNRRILVLIGSVLLLLAIGGGIAMAVVPPGAAPLAVATTGTVAAIPTSALPTALPLPQAIGDVDSTEPVAQVGDVAITRGDFVRAYQPGSAPSDVLKQLIQIELVVQAAQSEGFRPDPAVVDETISQIKQQNEITSDADFQTLLQQSNIASEEELRQLLLRDQIVEHMLLSHTIVAQVHVRHILLIATGDKVAARKAEAEELLQQIQSGTDFAQLANEKSEDAFSNEKGGDLGWIPRGLFGTAFDDAAFSLAKDELRLVQSDTGWHIVQLIDLPEKRGLESSDMLSTTGGQQAFTDTFIPWVNQLQATAEAAQKIKILATDEQLVTQTNS
ncbi:MAG: peptidylprolyl isomerase [Oscillochloris sp.]|nr:peptidylprolyl isomerase [Oscillochloris sp.]